MAYSLMGLVSLVPALVLDVVGLVLALVRWQRHPMTSLLFVVSTVIRVTAQLAAFVVPMTGGFESGGLRWLFMLTGLAGHVGGALLIAAVFVERRVEPGPGVGYGEQP